MNRIRRQIRAAEERLFRSVLAQLPRPDEMATVELAPASDGRPATGTRPSAMLSDASGRKYFFKQADPDHIAGEEMAGALRTIGRRPHVPAVGRAMDLPGVGAVEGLLQPWVEPVGDGLPDDTSEWSPLQREAMVRDHPWEWMLANLDTHADQYLLLGPDRLPVNIDWDHSLADLDTTELTRFTTRKATLAPLRNKLYDDYVHGRVDLWFGGLFDQVRRILGVSPRRLAELVRQYGRTCRLEPERVEELVAKVLERQRALPRDFSNLVRNMKRERSLELRGARRPFLEQISTRLREKWQRLVIEWVHPVVMRRVYAAYRWFLSLWTRRRAAREG